jgi:hypothetical protein
MRRLALLFLVSCGGAFTSGPEEPPSDSGSVCFPALTACRTDGGCRQGAVCLPHGLAEAAGLDAPQAPPPDEGLPDVPTDRASPPGPDAGRPDAPSPPPPPVDAGHEVSHPPTCSEMPADWCGDLDSGTFCPCLGGDQCFGHTCVVGEG